MVSVPPTDNLVIARAEAALEAVCDPELPFLTIRDIGILRAVRLADGVVEVAITPTYSGCPANDVIAIDIVTTLARAGIDNPRIVIERNPPWTTDWITAEAREKLAQNGIAPPPPASGKRALFDDPRIACPQCSSGNTELISAFGSTACKSQHRCRACREPFEAFKCI